MQALFLSPRLRREEVSRFMRLAFLFVEYEIMKLLITGASGMLGQYVKKVFTDEEIATLGRSEANDIRCDLSREVPALGQFDLVVHCAGSHEDDEAMATNLEGTRNLLKALEKNPPRFLVFVSCYDVYKPGSGENIGEEHVDWNDQSTGSSKALAEADVAHWVREREEVTLTVVRPARMFGSGIGGEMARMFNEVAAGRYIHIRGEQGKLSIVTALDVARAIRRLYEKGGVYNLSDGEAITWLQLAEAMSANAGKYHRPFTLPRPWAGTIKSFFGFVPLFKEQLDPERLDRRNLVLTLDNKKALEVGVTFHNTLEVIRREAKDYPYEDE